jgi:Tfp pilus assembly protein PilO
MALDMNVDVGSLIKGLFSKKDAKEGAESAPNPHTKTILVVVAVFVFITLYVYFVYLPTKEDLRIKNNKISQIESIKFEINELSVNIEQIQKDLKIAQAEYERRSTLFYTNKELEDLYGQISLLAMKNKLTITKIEKGIEKPIFSDGNCANNSMGNEDEIIDEEQFIDEEMEGAGQLQQVGYYDFSVNLEITGNYSQFTNFRNGLAQLNKIMNINKESIVVGSESKGGDVKVVMIIATYRLPKNEAEQCADPTVEINEEEF